MCSANELHKKRFLLSALGVFALATFGFNSAGAQTADRQNATVLSQIEIPAARAVGVKGRLSRVLWSTGSGKDLYAMRLLKTASRLERAPGAMKNTKIWMARADICSPPGDEILMQIRGPLTCGSLGCEMVILSEASGAPRVLLHTIGDTIDSPATDEVTINQGSSRQRDWKYDNSGLFALTRKR